MALWPKNAKICWCFLWATFASFWIEADVRRLPTAEILGRPSYWLVKDYSRIIKAYDFPIWGGGSPVPNRKSNYGQNNLLNFLFSIFWLACIMYPYFPRDVAWFLQVFFPHPCSSRDFRFPLISTIQNIYKLLSATGFINLDQWPLGISLRFPLDSLGFSLQEMPSNKWRWGDSQGLVPGFAERARTWTPGQDRPREDLMWPGILWCEDSYGVTMVNDYQWDKKNIL